jgi:hypothetical protein
MKANKQTLFATVAVILALILLGSSLSNAAASPPLPDYRPAVVGEDIRNMAPSPENIVPPPPGIFDEEAAVGAQNAADVSACLLDTKTFLTLDNYNGIYFFTDFQLLAEDDTAQIWVQTDLSWPAGDPRATPEVTCEQAEYLLSEFSGNIYPTEVDFFGAPNFHDGSNSLLEAWGYVPDGYYDDVDGRQVVLVANVRDLNYYDSTYPLYIAGFFSTSLEAYFDRNTMTIDGFNWEDRTGPDSERPFLYEGVFAHEYQHLLHSDYDGDEESWINEGLSDLAEYLVGYGHPDSHVQAAADLPENSLTVWEDQGNPEVLADYGRAYLFQLYLMEKFGQEFIQAEFHNTDNSITGVNSTLAALGHNTTFTDLYHDWSAAQVLDSKFAGGRYEFQNLDFQLNLGTPDSPNPEAYDTPGAPPWGTDYLWLDGDPKELGKLSFNGKEISVFPTGWSSDGDVLYGGHANLLDNWAIFETTGGGALTFDTMYDIEANWDFGFVQVSTDGGHTWTSLANAYTTDVTDPSAISTVVENVPGLTGNSGGWVNMSFDLSAYAGQDILVAFRYVTDWATVNDGWYVDNVMVDGNLVSDGSSTDPFKDITDYIPVTHDFAVTFIGIKDKANGNPYKVVTLKLSDLTEDGLMELNKVLKTSDSALMLVTYEAAEDATEYAPYTYEFTYTNAGPKK